MSLWKRSLGGLFSAGAVWFAPAAPEARRSTTGGPIAVDTLAAMRSRFLPRTRMVRVFLPVDYATSTDSYPVLYANDGQDMEALGLVETLERLQADRSIQPVIVVAVHATDARRQEYGVAGTPNAQGLGAEAGSYHRFMVEELRPFIEQRYRVRRGPAETALLGWSLGGLAAFDLAWRHPESFGTVGVMSGSFWWRTDDGSPAARQVSRIMHRVVRESRNPPQLRMWFEAGRDDEAADRDGDGVIDAIQDTRELMDELAAKGFQEGSDMIYLEVDGGHNQATWGSALPAFLGWAYGQPRNDR